MAFWRRQQGITAQREWVISRATEIHSQKVTMDEALDRAYLELKERSPDTTARRPDKANLCTWLKRKRNATTEAQWILNRASEVYNHISMEQAVNIAFAELQQSEIPLSPLSKPNPRSAYERSTGRDAHKVFSWEEPEQFFQKIGCLKWFCKGEDQDTKRRIYVTDRDAQTLPCFPLQVIDRRDAGDQFVYDISVPKVESFLANGVVAHNCIDGRLTSAWNWCSKLDKKRFYHIFKLTGFNGFDGDWQR
jgi:hypothetical protein